MARIVYSHPRARRRPDFGGLPLPDLAVLTFLALDLASERTGLCLWHGGAPIATTSQRLHGDRLKQRARFFGPWLHDWLAGQHGYPAPGLLVIETPDLMAEGMPTTPATLRALYTLLGVAWDRATLHRIETVEVDPRLVRDRLCRDPHAAKQEAQRQLVLRGYDLPATPTHRVDHDAADALALAVVVADELTWQGKHRSSLDGEMPRRRT